MKNNYIISQLILIKSGLTVYKFSLILLCSVVLCCFCGCKESPPLANFDISSTTIQKGESVNFNNLSSHNPEQWQWTFEGGTPSSSNKAHPSGIVYSNPGTYEVTLTVSNSGGSNVRVENIVVLDDSIIVKLEKNVQELLDDGVAIDDILQTYPVDSLYGKKYAGGLFFYYANGEGYVAKELDEPILYEWGCKTESVSYYSCNSAQLGGNGSSSFSRPSCFLGGSAVGVCDDLIYNGYTDWTLPTAPTLIYMYQNLHLNGHGSFKNEYYWSSCQTAFNTAKAVNFDDGSIEDLAQKYSDLWVRAIRKI